MSNKIDKSRGLDYWAAIEKFHKKADESEGAISRPEAEVLLKKKLIERLRAAADALETSHIFPGIYNCYYEDVIGKFAADGRTMETVSVTLSYPWGG